MTKYSIYVTHTRQTGVRHPMDPVVTWRASRLGAAAFAKGGRIFHSRATEDDGLISGIYEAIKHAESLGETLVLADLEVTVEFVTEILKRQKVEKVNRRTSSHPTMYQDLFTNIMSRARPL